MKTGETEIVAGLEIGSSKILMVIGQIFPDGVINIIGKGEASSAGVNKGIVTDLNALSQSIQIARQKAEDMADYTVNTVLLAISGESIECRNESGMCTVGSFEITEAHIEEAIHTAKSIKLNDDMRLLHVIPQDYVIDGRADVNDPKGLSASRLGAHVHLITCNSDMVKNLVKSLEKINLSVKDLIFSGLASSYAVVTDEEKELGVCVVDFGAGAMEISLYTSSYLRYSMVIPYGGSLITHDISCGLSTSKQDAETLKLKYGSVSESDCTNYEMIEVPGLGGREDKSVNNSVLTEIIMARYVELFRYLKTKITAMQKELYTNNINYELGAGIILTGGAAEIKGVVDCAKQELKFDVRVGYPKNVAGLTDYVSFPSCSTAVGLLHYYQKELLNGSSNHKKANLFMSGFKKIFKFVNKEL